MSQTFPVNGFKWIKELLKFNQPISMEDFIKIFDENNNKGCIIEVHVEYQKNLLNLHKDLLFLAERKKIENSKKLICSIHDKKNYVVHIKALKQTINDKLMFEKVHRVIQFNQGVFLTPYFHMNTQSRTKAKNDFEKHFFKLMNNTIFEKTMENVRNHRDIKLVTTDKRRNRLASESNYHTTKYFSKNLLATEI